MTHSKRKGKEEKKKKGGKGKRIKRGGEVLYSFPPVSEEVSPVKDYTYSIV